MQCPKCNHEPTLAEMQASPDCCSACGVYYAKVAPRFSTNEIARAEVAIKENVKFSDWLNSNPHMKVVGALLLGLIVGYFAGREHVKYEIKSAFQDSFKGLAGAFGIGAQPVEKAPEVKLPEKPGPISAAFIRKDFKADGYGGDNIAVVLDFKNDSASEIRAFDGVLYFTDLLGNKILDSKVAVNEPVAAGKILSWHGSIDYNQYIDRHRNFRFADENSIKLKFVLNKVLYADGRLQEFK